MITYFVDEHWHTPQEQESPWNSKHSIFLTQPTPFDFLASQYEDQ